MTQIPVFDGHNDFLLRLLRNPTNREHIWLSGNGEGHLDLPRMHSGGFAGGFFAIYISSPESDDAIFDQQQMDSPPYALPLPEALDITMAQPIALAMLGHLFWMERISDGAFTVCRTATEVRNSIARNSIAGIIHMEGAEAIDTDLDALYSFHQLGLRSLGPVWSRPTAFGHGVPFEFPGQPDTGPGLTEAGKELIKACNELGIMVDLSHLNEKGFDDVANISDAPQTLSRHDARTGTRSS